MTSSGNIGIIQSLFPESLWDALMRGGHEPSSSPAIKHDHGAFGSSIGVMVRVPLPLPVTNSVVTAL